MQNENHCYKKCQYFDNDVVCKALQEEQNCYQCMITELEMKRKDIEKFKSIISAYELENKKLKAVIVNQQIEETKKFFTDGVIANE